LKSSVSQASLCDEMPNHLLESTISERPQRIETLDDQIQKHKARINRSRSKNNLKSPFEEKEKLSTPRLGTEMKPNNKNNDH